MGVSNDYVCGHESQISTPFFFFPFPSLVAGWWVWRTRYWDTPLASIRWYGAEPGQIRQQSTLSASVNFQNIFTSCCILNKPTTKKTDNRCDLVVFHFFLLCCLNISTPLTLDVTLTDTEKWSCCEVFPFIVFNEIMLCLKLDLHHELTDNSHNQFVLGENRLILISVDLKS